MAKTLFEELHSDVANDLHLISKRFKPGVKLTLLARGEMPDGSQDLVVSEDDIDSVIKTLRILSKKKEHTLTK